jgi:hypothetical protein
MARCPNGYSSTAFVAVAVGVLIAGKVMALGWLGKLVHKK